MSDKPRLPVSVNEPESYEARFGVRVSRELTELKSKQRLAYEGRLSGYYSALVAPTGGKWMVGDKVWNAAPAEAGGAGSKFVLLGWVCTVTGTPGTWVEMRCLTGA